MAGAGSDGEPAVASDGAIAHVSNRGGTYEMWMSGGDDAPVRLTSIGGQLHSRSGMVGRRPRRRVRGRERAER